MLRFGPSTLILLATAGKFPRFGAEVELGSGLWWAYAGISVFLVIFAGIMSGLTLGLMSLGLVDLEVLERSGTAKQKKQAATILPVVQKQHQLLVTLLLCNAAAMEALPIFLDKMFNPVVAVVLSVTFVLAFGEVIPQAICSRYGLAVGANLVWLVRLLMILCYPVAFPVGKILDLLLGHHDSALFRRAQLKALVSIHGKEAGKGGELSHDETTIISGALDLTEKTAEEAMTPIESTFSLDVNSKLDWEAMGKILARGHSRVPLYDGNPRNIIGLLLVKSLLTVRPEAETPVSAISIRRIPRVPANLPLYDILNEFQKGSSHMAAVVKSKSKKRLSHPDSGYEASNLDRKKSDLTEKVTPQIDNGKKSWRENVDVDLEKGERKPEGDNQVKKHSQSNNSPEGNALNHDLQAEYPTFTLSEYSEDLDEGEVIGIITMEDVIEELLQEEIVDETDVYVDVHKRIRVAAASSMARASSTMRRANANTTPAMAAKQGFHVSVSNKQSTNAGISPEISSFSAKTDSLTEPLLKSGM
ncbi:hypothetical protein O6H91_03G066100 [Diphasiastrum complanatum]|nr:hypothetical protein O6H91_03G066100 [Diphasiastrum complanatum]KAJ7562361.1 hypothetical protein O6H91_03G066100 [Diphasiastrum complanatum]